MGHSPPNRGRRSYASGLDGIRALAVIAVILYHAGVPGLRGGFVGVDLFFVVSGYLVTGLLQREYSRTGRIRFGPFIARRGRRLVPALLLMLTVVSAATLALGRDLGVGLRTQLLGAFTFSSNWIQIARGTSYVSNAEPAILTHLWSLAVEEQFYLLWPAVCVVLLSLFGRRRRPVVVAILLAVASAAAMAATFRAGADPTRAYEGTDTHGFGLLLGAALAFARGPADLDRAKGGQQKRLTGLAAAAGPLALAVIAAGAVLLDDSASPAYRGGLLAVNVAAVVLVAVTVRGIGAVPTLLSLRLLRGVGRRSYALYLWHWPALVIAERMLVPSIGHAVAATIAIASALIATEISWRCVELPIRRRGVAGYLRSIRTMLFGPPAPTGGRSVGWLTAGSVRTGSWHRRLQRRRRPAGERIVDVAGGRRGRARAGQCPARAVWHPRTGHRRRTGPIAGSRRGSVRGVARGDGSAAAFPPRSHRPQCLRRGRFQRRRHCTPGRPPLDGLPNRLPRRCPGRRSAPSVTR